MSGLPTEKEVETAANNFVHSYAPNANKQTREHYKKCFLAGYGKAVLQILKQMEDFA